MAKFDERNFQGEPQKEYDIEQLLAEGGQILWRGRPNRKAYILGQVFKMLPFALIWLLFDGTFIGLMVSFGVFGKVPVFVLIFIIVFFLLHLIPVWIWLSNVITAGMRQKNMEYVFTERRILIKSGLVGIDVVNIYYADVESVNLKVGLLDRMLHVGDIYIVAKNKAQVLWDVETPYRLVTQLQKITGDIKADTYFPNELRPESNSGFHTKYAAEIFGAKESSDEKKPSDAAEKTTGAQASESDAPSAEGSEGGPHRE